jgi:hypothetical protein
VLEGVPEFGEGAELVLTEGANPEAQVMFCVGVCVPVALKCFFFDDVAFGRFPHTQGYMSV